MKPLICAISIISCFHPVQSQIIKYENEFALWDKNAPGSELRNFPREDYEEKWTYEERQLVKWITEPTIRVFPPKGINRRTVMIIYPGLVQEILNKVDYDKRIDDRFPPSFIVVSADDKVTPASYCIDFFNTLQSNNIPSELHIYQKGCQGFSLGNEKCNCDSWPDLFIR